jgi:hypothetical protein
MLRKNGMNIINKNKMEKVNLSVLLLLMVWSINVCAQIPDAPTAALTPNAAGLGLYGDIPISLYTGTPDISIPLYEIKVKDYTLPITLSYHAAGVRVDQHPGWVGLGWNLFAGGLITRNVNDLPDEFNTPTFGPITRPMANSGYYYNHMVLNTNRWNSNSYLRTVAQEPDSSFFDTAPDEFSFNFTGYSGKFYLDHNGNWGVQCDKPVKVEFDGTFFDPPFDKKGTQAEAYDYDWSHCFSGFTITADDGTKYVFGKDIEAIDFSTDFFTQYCDEWTATAWYLTKIVLPWGEEIDFNYLRFNFTNQMYIAVYHDLGTWTEHTSGWVPAGCQSASASTAVNRYYKGKLMSPAYLMNISTPNAVISFQTCTSQELRYDNTIYDYQESKFVYNRPTPTDPDHTYPFLPFLESDIYGYPNCLDWLQWCELETIEIYPKTAGDFVKTINFHYNNSSNHRLRLDSITEFGGKQHKFYYNNIQNLPTYLANKTDHWGFYNNTYAYLNDGNYPNYKNPSAVYTKYGVLEKITYPTGGYTEFNFEPHYYRKQLKENRWETPLINLLSNQLAGGVRIKSIKHFNAPNTSPDIVKEYYYVSDYLQNQTNAVQSSGVLGGQIKYGFDYRVMAFNDNNTKLKKSIFSSVSVLPSCHNAQGNHIGYTEVIEKMSDHSFCRYQFTNFDNGYMDDAADAIIQLVHTPYEPYVSKSIERGKMLLQETYDVDGKKVRSVRTEYEKTGNNYVRAMKATSHSVCPGIALGYDEGCAYRFNTYSVRLVAERDTLFDSSNHAIAEKTEYAYNAQNLVKTITKTNSDGSLRKQEMKYSADFTTAPYPAMFTKNILSPVVETSILHNSTLTEKAVNDYALQHNTFYAPVNFKYQKGGGTIEVRITSQYDSKGNIRETIADNNDRTVYLWSYNHQYPIVEIRNATYSQVTALISKATLNAIAAKSEPSAADWNTINGLRASLSNALVTTYKYKPLVGMTERMNPREVKTTYEYDTFSRLQTVKDHNGNVIEKYDYHYKNQ